MFCRNVVHQGEAVDGVQEPEDRRHRWLFHALGPTRCAKSWRAPAFLLLRSSSLPVSVASSPPTTTVRPAPPACASGPRRPHANQRARSQLAYATLLLYSTQIQFAAAASCCHAIAGI
ncbi:hypothetical protein GUJ93_ZPchr0004g40167 [Zizania palustris]|uniref:Uncharacterized protein n=1 Tax=Zizania palustris TaxID=103762 RepID=A0A8J5SLF0_ZIZPA|nr:hypothetical protein GUJ93_ZPchr0004g40167 [Zizania palustris]